MKMDLIEGSETSAIINQTPGNYPKENLLYSVHGESLKSYFTLQLMKMDLIEGSETSAIINQTPGNYPKENLLYSVHGESLKPRICIRF